MFSLISFSYFRRMKIGFDAKRAFKNRTGLGNYSRNLISAFCHFFPAEEIALFTPTKNDELFSIQENENLKIISPKSSFLSAYWRSFSVNTIVQNEQLDIYHGLSAELPLGKKGGKTKWVVTIHDLIFLHFPELYPIIDRKIYYRKTKYACEKADVVIAISEQTKRDLIEFLSVPSEKIRVVYQNCDASFALLVEQTTKSKIRKKYNLPEKFILTVGTIEKRKNAEIILQAMAKMEVEIPLVIVGKRTDYMNELQKMIQEYQLENRVLFLHQVTSDELPAIYQMATVFVYPSVFEGFGIPILEALSARIPVIAATGSCLNEVGGKDSLYFHPKDENQLATHLQLVLSNEDVRQKMISQGELHAQSFSAENFAKSTFQVYQEILKK